MKKLVLTTAALLAGTALAAAQGMNPPNKAEGAAPAPSAQQKAPAEKVAPHARQTTGQAAPKAEGDMKAGAEMKGDSKGADMKAGAKEDMKAKESMQKNDDKAGKAAASEKNDDKTTADSKSKMDDKKMDKKSAADEKADSKDKTTGQGAAGARAANLSTEQKTKIRTTFREKVKVKPETHVNFSISVGTRIPRTVHYHTVPAEVVTVYPAWRGYYFILVNEDIVIIDPSSFEIVAVIA